MIQVTVALAMIAKVLLDAILWLGLFFLIALAVAILVGGIALLLFRRARGTLAAWWSRDR